MSNKRLYIAFGIMFISLTINGCQSNDNSSVVPAFSDSVIEIEIPEPTDSLNEGQAIDREGATEIEGANASQGEVADSNVDVVEHTALTQEEIDELKANATTDRAKDGINAYESITNTGSWKTSGGGVATDVVGKPGDTSWRRMTDEEAQAALDKNINDIIAKAELEAGTWNSYWDGKIYFNPYEYCDAMRADVESTPDVIHDFE